MTEFGIEDKKEGWRLLIDLSKTSLNAVLLRSGNIYASFVGHSVHIKESYENLEIVLH